MYCMVKSALSELMCVCCAHPDLNDRSSRIAVRTRTSVPIVAGEECELLRGVSSVWERCAVEAECVHQKDPSSWYELSVRS
jgi:hypothetical protein